MGKRKTLDQFKEELYQINNKIDVIGDYKGTHTKILCFCKECNQKFQAYPSDLLQEHGCKNCSIKSRSEKRRYTHERFVDKLSQINSTITIIGQYVSSQTKIECRCNICNHIWSAKPNNLMNGSGCPNCYNNHKGDSLRWNTEQFIQQLADKNTNVLLISEYVDYNTKVTVQCKTCNNIFETTPHHLLNGHGCKKCASKRVGDVLRKDNVNFILELREINPNIRVLSKYINSKANVKCQCIVCGNEWHATPNNLLKGTGCIMCNRKQSKGEQKVQSILDNWQIEYVSQYTYDGLLGVNNRKLSYDFYIPSFNTLIEVQGQQHNNPVEIFGGEEQFIIQQEHDRRKREFAKNHNLKLLEVWYYDFDKIEEILNRELEVV